jgi:hypothetical protein
MTPAEHARMIDQQEFEAECRAVRERARQYTAERRRQERQRVDAWISGGPALVSFAPKNSRRGRKPKLYTAFGEAKTLSEWSTLYSVHTHTLKQRLKDGLPFEDSLTMKPRQFGQLHTVNGVSMTLHGWADHIGIAYDALLGRLRTGRTLAEALAMRGRKARSHVSKGAGVVFNFAPVEGTGAGSTAQETPEITFSEKAENA